MGIFPNVLDCRVNWSDSYRVSYEYRTEVITSRNGREQRRSLRANPRKTISFKATFTRQELHSFNRLLVASKHRDIRAFEATDFAVTTGVLAVGAKEVLKTGSPEWLVDGAYIALSYEGAVDFLQLKYASAGAILLEQGVDRVWPAGTKLHRVLRGSLNPDVKMLRPTNETATLALDFNVDPGSETFATSTDVPPFFGREVLWIKPNWISDLDLSHSHPFESVDYGRGRVKSFTQIPFGTATYEAAYMLNDPAEADYVRRFFFRMRGQRGEFYMPTWQNDLPLRVGGYAGGNTLRVLGTDIVQTYNGDNVHKAVAVLLRDGRILLNLVSEIASVNDALGNDSLIIVQDAWTIDHPIENVVMVCWLLVWRSVTDTLTIEWLTDQVAQTKLTLKTLEHLAVEV